MGWQLHQHLGLVRKADSRAPPAITRVPGRGAHLQGTRTVDWCLSRGVSSPLGRAQGLTPSDGHRAPQDDPWLSSSSSATFRDSLGHGDMDGGVGPSFKGRDGPAWSGVQTRQKREYWWLRS